MRSIGNGTGLLSAVSVEEALRDQVHQQAAVAALRERALSGLDVQTLMDEAAASVARVLEVEYCHLLELITEDGALLLRAGEGWKEGLVGRARVEAGVASQAGFTLFSGDPVVVEDLASETRFNASPLLTDHGVVSGVSVTIGGTDRPFGILGAYTARPRTFSEDDVRFVQAVADVLGEAARRHRAEKALRESERWYRSLIQRIPAAVIVHGADGRITVSNAAAREFLGSAEEEFSDKLASDLDCALLHEDGTPMGPEEYPVNRVLATGQPVRNLVVGVDHPAAGEIRWAVLSADPVPDDQGNVDRAIVTFLDVTERKRAEEGLRQRTQQLALLNQVSHAFGSTLDLDEVLATILDKVRDLLDVTGCSVWLRDPKTGDLVCRQAAGPNSEVVRRWRLAPGEGLAGWTTRHGESLMVQNAQRDERHAGMLGEQIGLALRSVVSVPLQVKGKVIGALQAVDTKAGRFGEDDLTLLGSMAASAAIAIENARLYEQAWGEISERRQAQEALQASLREKESLLQEIHHRVKNNLQVMTSLLRLQSRYTKNAHTEQALAASRNRIQSMALVHEHLYQSPDLARINLADYLRRYVPYLTRVYREQAQSITVSIDAEDTFLDIDGAVPCGLLINELVSNALKHAFPSERTGEIRIDLQTEDGQAALTVSDDGVGFPVDVDFRLAKSLGLQLVNTLVRQLNGTINLDRSQGTVFEVTFPAE
jgi:PAS domain S-box-containing protein